MTPTTKMAAAPRIRPSGSEDPRNRGLSAGIEAATAQVTSMATNMAAPPAWAVTRCVHLAVVGLGHVADLHGDAAGREGEGPGGHGGHHQQHRVPVERYSRAHRPGPPPGGHVPASVGYGGKPAHSSRTSAAHLSDSVLVVPVAQGPADQRADGPHLVGPHARRGLGGRAQAQARGDERRAGIVGDGVAVAGDAGPVEHLLGHLAGQLRVEGAQVDRAPGGSRCRPRPAGSRCRPGRRPRAAALATTWAA